MSDYIESTKKLIEQYIELRNQYMSQRKLENATGVPRQMIIKYEKGEVCPTVMALNRLLDPMGYELTIRPKEDNGEERKPKADDGNL